jgi:hypothetical protein
MCGIMSALEAMKPPLHFPHSETRRQVPATITSGATWLAVCPVNININSRILQDFDDLP